MIKDFLKSVADNIKQTVGNDLNHTIVIFPNKRASIFFNEYLVEKTLLQFGRQGICQSVSFSVR